MTHNQRCVCGGVCVCGVCVCVCSGKPYVMGTKCPHKDGNIQNPCPCGDIFGPHEETSL